MLMYRNLTPGPKRGVSLYSYSAEFGFEKTLEDCFEDVYDMGAHGIEILANTHIENYPYPSQAWVDRWFALLDKYELEPVEYGHWVDSHVLQDRDLTTEESVEFLKRDLRLAHRLGFRTAALALSDDSVPLDTPALKQEPRLALVMGTEGDGLPHATIAEADYTVRIPMAHGVDSLNVAAASAVAFWELRTI